jgi:hypothetical protein
MGTQPRDEWGQLPWGEWETPEEENLYWVETVLTKSKKQLQTSEPTRAIITVEEKQNVD